MMKIRHMLDQLTFRPFATIVTQDGQSGVCIWDSRPGVRLSRKKAVEIATGRLHMRANYIPEVNRDVVYFNENGDVWHHLPLNITEVVQAKVDHLYYQHQLVSDGEPIGYLAIGESDATPIYQHQKSGLGRLFSSVTWG